MQRHNDRVPHRRDVPSRFQALLALAALTLAGLAGAGTMQVPAGAARAPAYASDVAYDGRVTFVRLRWRSDGRSSRGGWSTAWDHDYPRAEQHLTQILRELTYLDVRLDGSRIITLEDPELFRFPIAFMWEPGFWVLNEREASAFRAYLLKGGFVVFEDFDGREQWAHFEEQIRRVLPGARLVKLEQPDPIFDSFFRVNDINSIVHPMYGLRPSYYGIYEDNDPSKRLMVVANFDNDVPEYWEWSGDGLFPFSNTSEAYKLGVNYFVYGMTH